MYCRFAAIGVGHEIQYPMQRATSSIDEGDGEGEEEKEEITSETGDEDEDEDEDNLEGSGDDMSDEEDFRF